ncbi:MAG: nitrous oxide reductase family maturation protein NosD [Chitinophagia bacterium]|nr:nitrous oxide reductase family maturation protein NosD [Chitinophagia bacterium]NCA30332.1 nitrous oxide reductase family maturation protein NosD [Chitinophagia bacterium]
MKKVIVILMALIFWVESFGHIIHVGPLHKVKSIRTAIRIANNGDTILVAAGMYKEGNLIISKQLTLIGDKYPIIDGQNKYEVFSIKASKVVIDGFKIYHSGTSNLDDYAGIKVYDSREVTIQNNILDDTYFGIYLQYAKRCVIKNNQLKANNKEEQQSGNGIHCWKSDSLSITDNTVDGHRDGIYFEFVTNSSIKSNTTSNNIRYGLHFMFSNNDTYQFNSFIGNGAGVAVMYSNKVSMLNNQFKENWGDAAYGLLLKEISDSYITGNTFEKNTTGIYLEGASSIKMDHNIFKNNGWAMKIQASCMDIKVSTNNFVGNTFDIGTNGSLVLNTFNKNYWDKYEGYDLNHDTMGDIPYRPVSMYSMIVEQNPPAMMLFRSFITSLLDKTEKFIPSLTPENLKDNTPLMRKAF